MFLRAGKSSRSLHLEIGTTSILPYTLLYLLVSILLTRFVSTR